MFEVTGRHVSGPGLFQAQVSRQTVATVEKAGKLSRVVPIRHNRINVLLGQDEQVIVETDGPWSWSLRPLPSRYEANDGIPCELAVPEDRPLSLREELRRYIQVQLSDQAERGGYETEEEANDFDVEEEDELSMTGYEVIEMDPEYLLEDQQPTGDNSDSTRSEDEDNADRHVPSEAVSDRDVPVADVGEVRGAAR